MPGAPGGGFVEIYPEAFVAFELFRAGCSEAPDSAVPMKRGGSVAHEPRKRAALGRDSDSEHPFAAYQRLE